MQKAKDSFYMALRERLAALNPQRTVEIDGTQRPGIVVLENEDASTNLRDTFCVRWSKAEMNDVASSWVECEIEYATRGTSGDGLDRGRALAAMDAELVAICKPISAAKFDYAQMPAAELTTPIFWSAPKFGNVESDGDLMRRTASLKLYYFAEGR